MYWSVADYFVKYGYRQKDIEKARVYELIQKHPGVTRKKLYLDMAVRPNNVSAPVQELIDSGLVYEEQQKRVSKKGRPETILYVNNEKYVSIAIWCSGAHLSAALVNLNENIYATETATVDTSIDEFGFISSLYSLIDKVLKTKSDDQILLGIGFSLPGVINQRDKIWIFNSYWPSINGISLSPIEKQYSVPVFLSQKMESELESFLKSHPEYSSTTTLLFHWGYGIGASYARHGKVINSEFGSFCEVGHIKTGRNEGRLCKCGEYDCVETVAALWAVSEALEKRFGKLPSDNEDAIATILKSVDILSVSEIQDALDTIIRLIDASYRIFYPDRIICYGPFFQNEELFCEFNKRILLTLPSYSREYVKILRIPLSMSGYGSVNCTNRFFFDKLKTELIALN